MKNKRVVLTVFRDAAVVAFLSMLLHMGLALLGIASPLAQLSFYMPLPVGCIAIGLSFALNYCAIHQLCLAYSTLVSLFIANQEFVGIMKSFTPQAVVFGIGILLLVKILFTKVWIKKQPNAS